MSTTSPADLAEFRAQMIATTGLGAVEVGILPDSRHLASGGYHCGRSDLAKVGRYGPIGAVVAGIKQTRVDYSVTLGRDRGAASEHASAGDIGGNWPKGGRAAWLRWNNALVAALKAGVPDLAPLRAVNYSPDGVAKRRIDRQTGLKVEPSTDSVDGHTHIEWYRDTLGKRQACLLYLVQLAQAAISPPPTLLQEDDDVTVSQIANRELKAGFGFDENGHPLADNVTTEIASEPLAGATDGAYAGWPHATLVLSAARWGGQPLKVRVTFGDGSTPTRWLGSQVATLTDTSSRYWLSVPAGTAMISLGRQRISSTDILDDAPVGINLTASK